jgi:hypothetical protein
MSSGIAGEDDDDLLDDLMNIVHDQPNEKVSNYFVI